MVKQDFFDRFSAVAEKVVDKIGDDLATVFTTAADGLEGAVDGFSSDATIKGSVTDAYKAGHANARDFRGALRARYDSMQGYLNEQVKTDTGVGPVGFFDGFCNAYLGTAAERRPTSKQYQTHVKYGKAIGLGSAAYLFVKGKGVSKFVGVLPVISRFFRYIGATLEEAQKDVAAAYAEPAKPVM
ncbi:MAG: hypothetical protein Q7R56_01295, partial [Nanoarchaeota archaeon]|nr:hypothetical protein [Nanoarchaeota archaeon]